MRLRNCIGRGQSSNGQSDYQPRWRICHLKGRSSSTYLNPYRMFATVAFSLAVGFVAVSRGQFKGRCQYSDLGEDRSGSLPLHLCMEAVRLKA